MVLFGCGLNFESQPRHPAAIAHCLRLNITPSHPAPAPTLSLSLSPSNARFRAPTRHAWRLRIQPSDVALHPSDPPRATGATRRSDARPQIGGIVPPHGSFGLDDLGPMATAVLRAWRGRGGADCLPPRGGRVCERNP